ncbi:hypothetical protein [Pikeienuella sp. HZG-20]|uniref:hypothetical protein n=1 Tax=Paludibacillus litoralis TaxID=3133267 RepID=UPI0030EEC3F2
MASYTYKTVAAPRRVRKARGVKGPDAALARAMDEIIAAEAAAGWEYLRTDALPVEEGGGFFSRATTTWRAVLVFRREAAPRRAPAPDPAPEFEPRDPDAPREPFMRVATTTPASPNYQAPPVGGAKRE